MKPIWIFLYALLITALIGISAAAYRHSHKSTVTNNVKIKISNF